MKTIVKAKTNKLAVDGWGRTYHADTHQNLVIGETYMAHNKRIKHMLLPQEIVLQVPNNGHYLESNTHLELIADDNFLLDKDFENI
jgi:hypothetical protein